jgi:tRNA(Ile2)-agmatinylcytidine synthase
MEKIKGMIFIPKSTYWIGLDDTDSLAGGCTTYTFKQLLQSLEEISTIMDIRLVRLWPFAPRRTRGNAAVCARVEVEKKAQFIDAINTFWEQNILPLQGSIQDSHHSNRMQHPADPGLVVFEEQPPEDLYIRGVRHEVKLDELPIGVLSLGGQGRIGATCAVAWRAKLSTWEAIAYRRPHSNGQRQICLDTLHSISNHSGIFLTVHSKNNQQLVAPKGQSPVLFGIRGTTQKSVEHACEQLINAENTEEAECHLVFETNQATNDHIEDSKKFVLQSIHVDKGHVNILSNCHQELRIHHESGGMNRIAKQLVEGDVIVVRGLNDLSDILHVEHIKISHLVPRRSGRPKCTTCDRTMKSMGKGQGIRCPICKEKHADGYTSYTPSIPLHVWMEPPDDQRRHLTRPLNLSMD